MTLEGTTDFFLQQGNAFRLLYERAEPLLWVTDYVNAMQDDKAAFTYRYDDVGMDADPKKKKPAHAQIGGDFPEINMSRLKYTSGMTESRGFQIRVPRNIIREEPKGISEILRAYKFAGYWMARFINDEVLAVILAGATVPTWTPTTTWDLPGATPFSDLRTFKNTMKREGYVYQMTDIILANENYEELEGYLATVDITDMQRLKIYGTPTINGDVINIPLIGNVRGVLSGMTEGTVLGLDKANSCAELHYYNDAKFATDTVSYETVKNGTKQEITAPNIGFHFKTWVEDSTEDTIMRFWVEDKCVITEALAARKDTGI